MGLTRGLKAIDGNFESIALMQAADLEAEPSTTVFVNDGATIQWYEISTSDSGSGVPLDNGNYANPVSDPQISVLKSFPPISVPTALLAGGRYFSTATNTHTLANGVSVGDMVNLTWKAGTIATVTAASNITFTDKDGVTTSDTVWVFDYPIVEIVLTWSGTEWEIK